MVAAIRKEPFSMKRLPISCALALGTALFATQAYSYTNPQSGAEFSTLYLDGRDMNNPDSNVWHYDGIYLFRGQNLMAPYCRYNLMMQNLDGNLVLYGNTNFSQADWWTSTQGTNSQYAELQGIDGNFVVYTMGRTATWNSNSNNRGVLILAMQSDGNLVSYYEPYWQ
jgi:hypothetical protein